MIKRFSLLLINLRILRRHYKGLQRLLNISKNAMSPVVTRICIGLDIFEHKTANRTASFSSCDVPRTFLKGKGNGYMSDYYVTGYTLTHQAGNWMDIIGNLSNSSNEKIPNVRRI